MYRTHLSIETLRLSFTLGRGQKRVGMRSPPLSSNLPFKSMSLLFPFVTIGLTTHGPLVYRSELLGPPFGVDSTTDSSSSETRSLSSTDEPCLLRRTDLSLCSVTSRLSQNVLPISVPCDHPSYLFKSSLITVPNHYLPYTVGSCSLPGSQRFKHENKKQTKYFT